MTVPILNNVTSWANSHNYDNAELPQLHFLPGPPILAQTSRVASAQGGVDRRSIDGTDETMESKASFTAVRAGD